MSSDSGGSAKESLRPGEVHVWLVHPHRISDDKLLARYRGTLSAEEQARERRFHFERHRHSYLVSHALVRSVLSRYAPEVSPQEWVFVTNRWGRPEVESGLTQLPLRFNLSHTTGLAACAVTLTSDVGVDVEHLERRAVSLELAEHHFAPAEVRALQDCPLADRQRRFLSYWTLKESYIKARGLGLALPLELFSFDLEEPSSIRIAFDPQLGDDPSAWQFSLSQPTPEHLLALAVRATEAEVRTGTIQP